MSVKRIRKVREVDVAAVSGNRTLEAGVERCALERCKDAIEKLGVMHTPVVGATEKGERVLLSGQCELTALRELGVRKMEAVEVEVGSGGGAGERLALLLMSLRVMPGALCEGHLLRDAIEAGVEVPEIKGLLGKSSSWVSNRLSLVRRLDRGVYEMVRGGQLCPRSAQEVSRLPSEVQFAFAERAVREGLPKSAIESLVAGYRDETCPDAVRSQIVGDPASALRRMADRRRPAGAGCAPGDPPDAGEAAGDRIKTAIRQVSAFGAWLCGAILPGGGGHGDALRDLEAEVSLLLGRIRRLVSPGKTEVAGDA